MAPPPEVAASARCSGAEGAGGHLLGTRASSGSQSPARGPGERHSLVGNAGGAVEVDQGAATGATAVTP